MTNAVWNPDVYSRFAELRARPFWELVDGIDTASTIESMVDLGCGSGELTSKLADRIGVRRAIGVDSSPAMLDRAAGHASEHCAFVTGDIATWVSDEPVGLVIANASLQWVPDHPTVIAQWADQLGANGQLAIQVPANADHPSHTCSTAVAEREPFRSAMGGAPPPDPVATNVLAPETYAELLHGLGFDDPRVRLVVYPQVMTSTASVVEWTRGTSLNRYFARLPDGLHEPFVEAYRRELLVAVGDRVPYFYTFKRILINAARA